MAVDDEGHRRASLSAKSEMENIASDILEQRVPTLPLVSWRGEVAQPSTPEPLGRELVRRGQQIAVRTLRHGLVRQLADGSLPQETFLRYLVQNALFLTGYAAALREALARGVPSSAASLLTGLETALSGPAIDRHVAEYRSRAGRDPGLQTATPSPVTMAYASQLHTCAGSGGVAILVAILPGEQSYAAAGRYYAASGDLTPANPYAGWIAQYAAGHVDELVAEILAGIAAAGPGPVAAGPTKRELLHAYERSARLDEQFWEMAGRPGES
jgi:thiaminase